MTGKELKRLIISLFGKQLVYARPVLSPVLKFFIQCHPKILSANISKITDNWKDRYVRPRHISPEQLQAKITACKPALANSDFSPDSVKISFCGATRRKGNPNNKLTKFLDSVIAHATNINTIEVLLAVDPDDHLDYFIKIKEKYAQKLRLRIIISERRLGYENLHLYDTLLFPFLAPNTRMICDYSDDCTVTAPGFDKQLLQVDSLYPDNIYFIHTRDTQRDKFIGNVTENIQLLYWAIQAKEPASYFPIFSRKVLDIAYEYAGIHDMKNEWSPIANAWICDCYVDILSIYIKKLGHDRIHYINMIEMNKTILANYQYPDPITGLTPNNRAFIKMLSNHTLSYLEGLANAIASHANTLKTTKNRLESHEVDR